ncbi:vitamin-D-receptor interacting mediator subunit 4-domain-containing protein [Lipomyces doorenjongii]|uniref:vitamin-D-receptor interacting mediator subunit 4-domain-containing protein n=1 Tax=Lipomyces doorenjongii TaxID=383834 RepID=UPI0034CD8A96
MAISPRAPQSLIAMQPLVSANLPQSPATAQPKSSSTIVPPRSLADAIAERKQLFQTHMAVPGIQPAFQKLKTPLQSIPTSTDFTRSNTPSSATTPLTSTTPTTVSGYNALPTSAPSAVPKLAIFGALDAFEHKIAHLIETVGLYSPGAGICRDLVGLDLQLGKAVNELLLYQENKALIAKLSAESSDLDSQLHILLKALSDARAALLSIPGANDLGSRDIPDTAKTSYTELLAYATKISKFASAPPGFAPPPAWASRPPPELPITKTSADGQASTVAETVSATLKEAYKDPSSIPANLPWPAEDEMRRGMLVQYNRMFGSDGGENGVVATEIAVVVPGQEGHPDNKPHESPISQVQTNTSQPPPGNKRTHGEKRRHKRQRNAFASDIDGDYDSDDGDGEEEDDDDLDDGGHNDDGTLSSSSDYADTQDALPRPNSNSGLGNNGTVPASNGSHVRPDGAVNREALLDLDLFEPDED